ncbi:enoyl-CoA hydratase/carnithine racemase [Murinocardiopsis flavida]|uniref:Enoyl-CoA hydratase/carnithine racemase n=1 Tax=Murinocardiopsis flavida TaxID=645275 RepID=A0A2P8DTS8_9ACTN|nr:enoyl-CoA hydratase [Murinocardiopsis flavida]PSL00621.1 enoyl-CoA hydratase/carnithine racemase [Murinocardiopsis flavida]
MTARSTPESAPDTAELLVERGDGVLTVTFNRPDARNAMTWAMYEGLYAACELADGDPGIRAMVLRGSGTKAFVAGTDIGQFAEFTSGSDGVAYEARITRVVNRLEDVDVPTLAAVRGYCVGGGLAIAAACDLRIGDDTARFGVPIARTLGNTLSANSLSLLVHHLGPARTLDLLLRADFLGAADAAAAGFLAEVCAPAELDDRVGAAAERLLGHAPLTMRATKELVRRMRRRLLVEDDDVVEAVFGSEDFAAAVSAFGSRTPVRWQGR